MINIDELSLEERIGQMFMVGLQENKENEIKKLIKERKIGGVIVYRRNYQNYEEMIRLINNIKNSNKENSVPILISIDQEGGRVNRMPDEILNLKSATKIANTKNIGLIKESGSIIGKMLKETGILMNYAPTLDIRRFEENHPIGDRCYGNNKEDVTKYGIEVMKQMQGEGVIPVIKHFPGHGLTKKDSHFKIPKITQKIEELEENDIVPFEEAIKEGADAIMVGHLIIKDIDSKYPASLSKEIINKYLINKYNYKGLIITDDLKMMAIRLHFNMKFAVKKAIEAGNDIIMVGLPYCEIEKIIKDITKKVKSGEIDENRINSSVKKILEIKEKYNVNDAETKGFNINQVNYKIERLNEEVEIINKNEIKEI